MPLIHGYSSRARSENIRRLIHEGYPRKQAAAIAYRIAREARAEVDDELGDILSEDFWISPNDAKEALAEVRKSVVSFDADMRNALAANTIPPTEAAEWARWKRQFDAYYRKITESFMGWRLADSTGVLLEAERMANDLGAWRQRFRALAKVEPTTPAPVRTHAGPTQGPVSSILTGLAVVGAVGLAWRIYSDLR